MLVLGRKQDEGILIGGNVTVTILAVRGNNVRLGIDAPPEVRVLRGELLKPITAPQPAQPPTEPTANA
jgi:carbon storage regulator